MNRTLILLVALMFVSSPVMAAPKTRATKALAKTAKALTKTAPKQRSAKKDAKAPKGGASARVAFALAGELRPAREVIGRRDTAPLSLEEDIAKQIDVPLVERPLSEAEALAADEVFITSTTREISWVTQWNGKTVGGGTCGPITLKLHKALQEKVAQDTRAQ